MKCSLKLANNLNIFIAYFQGSKEKKSKTDTEVSRRDRIEVRNIT